MFSSFTSTTRKQVHKHPRIYLTWKLENIFVKIITFNFTILSNLDLNEILDAWRYFSLENIFVSRSNRNVRVRFALKYKLWPNKWGSFYEICANVINWRDGAGVHRKVCPYIMMRNSKIYHEFIMLVNKQLAEIFVVPKVIFRLQIYLLAPGLPSYRTFLLVWITTSFVYLLVRKWNMSSSLTT